MPTNTLKELWTKEGQLSDEELETLMDGLSRALEASAWADEELSDDELVALVLEDPESASEEEMDRFESIMQQDFLLSRKDDSSCPITGLDSCRTCDDMPCTPDYL